jgi:hypothetical protein
VFSAEELLVQCEFTGLAEGWEGGSTDDKDLLVALNCVPDQAMADEGVARNLSSRVQRLRKEAGLQVADSIEAFFKVLAPGEQPATHTAGGKGGDEADAPAETASAEERAALEACARKMSGLVGKLIGKPFLPDECRLPAAVVLLDAVRDVDGVPVRFVLAREAAVLKHDALAKVAPGADEQFGAHVQQLLAACDAAELKARAGRGEALGVRLDGQQLELRHGEHFTLNSLASLASS